MIPFLDFVYFLYACTGILDVAMYVPEHWRCVYAFLRWALLTPNFANPVFTRTTALPRIVIIQ